MWQKKVVSTVILSIVFPLLLFVLSPFWSSLFNSGKSLEYREVYRTNITNITSNADDWSNLNVTYKGEKLDVAYLVNVKFVNTGDEPIERNDFDKKIVIKFIDENKVIGIKKKSSIPYDLDVINKFSDNHVFILPLLLNPKDEFTLEFLIKGDAKLQSVNGRISGVKEIVEMDLPTVSGVYIHKVTPNGPSRSLHLKLFRFNEYLLVCISFLFFLCSVHVERQRMNMVKSIYPVALLNMIGVFAGVTAFSSIGIDYFDIENKKVISICSGIITLIMYFLTRGLFRMFSDKTVE